MLPYLYEERITLWRAASIDAAIEMAEAEAQTYAADDAKFLGLSQAYHLPDETPLNGIEVFSLLRESSLPPSAYIDQFFESGSERQQK